MNEKKVIVFSSIFLILVIGAILLSFIGEPTKADDIEEIVEEEIVEEDNKTKINVTYVEIMRTRVLEKILTQPNMESLT